MRSICILIFALFFSNLCQAQVAIGTYQFWFDYDQSLQLEKRKAIYGDAGVRTLFPNDWWRIYVRPGIRFSHKPLLDLEKSLLQYHLGLGTFLTLNIQDANSLEIRPFQGVSIHQPNFEHVLFDHYFRLEERIELNGDQIQNQFGFRGRYRLRLTFIWKEDKLDPGFSYPVSIELFANLNKELLFNDVFRIFAGAEYRTNRKSSARFEIAYHRTNNTGVGGVVTNDLIFRFRLYRRIIKKTLNKE